MLKKEIKLLFALALLFSVCGAYAKPVERIRVVGKEGNQKVEFYSENGKSILKTINIVNKVEILKITKNIYKLKGLPQEFTQQFNYEFKNDPSKIIFMRKGESYFPSISTIYSPTRDSIRSQYICISKSIQLNTGKELSDEFNLSNIVDIYDVNGKKLYTLKDIEKYGFSNTNKYFIYSPFADSKKARILNIKDNKEYEIGYLGETIFSNNDLYLLFVNHYSLLLSMYDLDKKTWAIRDYKYIYKKGEHVIFDSNIINETNKMLEIQVLYYKSKSDSIVHNFSIAKIDTIRF